MSWTRRSHICAIQRLSVRTGLRSLLARLGVLAAFAESRNDTGLAEGVYRRIQQLDPDAHVAINNLAMILSTKEDSIDEALALASKFVQSEPLSADYQDTLNVVAKSAAALEGTR